tara:strand:+ start:299 stop:877 length:579 start_codon:yes stop_codon:yes gene_type:complete
MGAENTNGVGTKISSQKGNEKSDEKWYQQFWPWFLIALPGTVVVACFYTLYIALTYPHSMVDDSYYKEGLAINKTLAQDREATALGLRAQVSFFSGENSDQVDVTLTAKGAGAGEWPNLQLLMLHPGSQKRDQIITLEQVSAGQYRATIPQHYEYSYYQYSYYLRLVPENKSWRLNGQIDFQYGAKTALQHD